PSAVAGHSGSSPVACAAPLAVTMRPFYAIARARRYAPRVMTLHAHAPREIAEGPTGPRVAALFDVDGTLIAGFSAVAFLRDRVTNGRMGVGELGEALLATAQFGLGRLGFSGLIAATARWLTNVPEQELEELAERIFARDIASAIYPEAHNMLRTHHHMCTTLALT